MYKLTSIYCGHIIYKHCEVFFASILDFCLWFIFILYFSFYSLFVSFYLNIFMYNAILFHEIPATDRYDLTCPRESIWMMLFVCSNIIEIELYTITKPTMFQDFFLHKRDMTINMCTDDLQLCTIIEDVLIYWRCKIINDMYIL